MLFSRGGLYLKEIGGLNNSIFQEIHVSTDRVRFVVDNGFVTGGRSSA